MFRKKRLRLWLVGLIALLLLAVPVVQAATQPMYFLESFDRLVIHQPGDTQVPYWVILNGDAGQYYAPCGDASCVTAEKEGRTAFARLQIKPDQTPGNYTGSEISELRTGYSAGQGRWLPAVGHPVIATARVRFSPNYKADGTGGAIGSAGFWLWNSYIDFSHQTALPIEAFGFSWGEQGTWFGMLDGLQISALQDNAPLYRQRVTPEHPDRWMLWTMIWSVNRAGEQRLDYALNGQLIGSTTLPRVYTPLSITFWNDNQYVGADETSAFTIQYHQPSAAQNFDVDSVLVFQP